MPPKKWNHIDACVSQGLFSVRKRGRQSKRPSKQAHTHTRANVTVMKIIVLCIVHQFFRSCRLAHLGTISRNVYVYIKFLYIRVTCVRACARTILCIRHPVSNVSKWKMVKIFQCFQDSNVNLECYGRNRNLVKHTYLYIKKYATQHNSIY